MPTPNNNRLRRVPAVERLILSGVLCVLLGWASSVALGGRGDHLSAQAVAPARPPSPDTVDLAGIGYEDGPISAPVKVAEFSDFACGFCKQFHETVFPDIVKKYVASGQIQWRYVPIVLGMNREGTASMFSHAVEGARAGYCAGDQDKFNEMRDHLFAHQAEWTEADNPGPILARYADELELDSAAFSACYEDPLTMQRIVKATQAAEALNVRGTPSFWVVGLGPLQGVQPMTTWDTIVERLGGGAGQRP